MSEWKELDIKNLPNDFYDNEKYRIQANIYGEWKDATSGLKARKIVIGNAKDNYMIYRYKIEVIK